MTAWQPAGAALSVIDRSDVRRHDKPVVVFPTGSVCTWALVTCHRGPTSDIRAAARPHAPTVMLLVAALALPLARAAAHISPIGVRHEAITDARTDAGIAAQVRPAILLEPSATLASAQPIAGSIWARVGAPPRVPAPAATAPRQAAWSRSAHASAPMAAARDISADAGAAATAADDVATGWATALFPARTAWIIPTVVLAVLGAAAAAAAACTTCAN
mmetsp:Transcript_9715/g.26389  ORF Transcript_9715/g.26389 Transcript_9715/m.26389 type:complete len:218 (-) Transcript_9715:1052-1705(-)